MYLLSISCFYHDSGAALLKDGKIVAAGSADVSGIDFAVVRYNADGSLDDTFSGDGKVTTAVGSGVDLAQSVAIQSDGKIVVAGYSDVGGGNYDFAVVRYNTDGSLDTNSDADPGIYFDTEFPLVEAVTIDSEPPSAACYARGSDQLQNPAVGIRQVSRMCESANRQSREQSKRLHS